MRIVRRFGGRGEGNTRGADIKAGEWYAAVEELIIFLRPGGPLSSGVEFERSVLTDVFLTVQQALQTGPLGGSKPAHFGRKSLSDRDAEQAHGLLLLLARRQVALGLTEPQQRQVVQWLAAAEKRLGIREQRVTRPPPRDDRKGIMEQSSGDEEEKEEGLELEGRGLAGGLLIAHTSIYGNNHSLWGWQEAYL